MKRCSTCGAEKPLEEFCINRRAKDGRNGRCRACCSKSDHAYRAANPEKGRNYVKLYRAAHPEVNRNWRKANAEKLKARNKAWCKANPDKVRASVRKYRAARAERKVG